MYLLPSLGITNFKVSRNTAFKYSVCCSSCSSVMCMCINTCVYCNIYERHCRVVVRLFNVQWCFARVCLFSVVVVCVIYILLIKELLIYIPTTSHFGDE